MTGMMQRCWKDDYCAPSFYMITLVTEPRRGCLSVLEGTDVGASGAGAGLLLQLSPMGEVVREVWQRTSAFYQGVEACECVVMTDHFHGILWVKERLARPMGHIVKAFKRVSTQECRSKERLLPPDRGTSTAPLVPVPAAAPAAGFSSLWQEGFQDTILLREGQLKAMVNYIADNPRRLLAKRTHPELFTVVAEQKQDEANLESNGAIPSTAQRGNGMRRTDAPRQSETTSTGRRILMTLGILGGCLLQTEPVQAQYGIGDDGVSLTIKTGREPRRVNRMDHRSNTSTVAADQVFNRGIKRGDTILVTGDKPRFALARTLPEDKMDPDIRKLGDGRIRIRCAGAEFWLDECEDIQATFRPSRTEYAIKSAKAENLAMTLWVSQASDWGLVARLTVSNTGPSRLELSAEFLYGGLSTHGRTFSAAYFKPDSAGNEVQVEETLGRLSNRDPVFAEMKVLAATLPPVKPANVNGRLSFVSALALNPGESRTVALCGGWSVPGRDVEKEVRSAQFQPLIAEAEANYAALLARAVISTPSQVLDCGFRNAVLNLDYVWARQAWLEGVHWWAAYWANNYQISAAVSLDQREKARTAFGFFGNGAEGPGAIGMASGLPKGGYDATPYYLYQLAQYYEHTGDDALVKELWPGLVKGVDRLLDGTDPDRDLLLGWHLHCNAFLYQADHLGLPGVAASPSLMMAGMLDRWSRIAGEMGQAEQARQWQDRAAKMHAAIPAKLWNASAGCFYSHVDNEAIPHMAHYYTDHVFPTLYSRLPEEYGWSSLRYLRATLCFERGSRLLMRVGNLKPTVFGNDNVMPVQMAEAARACFHAGDFDAGFRMLDAVARAGTVDTEAPGNFPERMNDDGKGEANYLFGNPIGSFIYGVVDGLFGLSLVERGTTVRWQPGFPDDWDRAELRFPYAQVRFNRETGTVTRCRFTVTTPEPRKLDLIVQLPPANLCGTKLNGKEVKTGITAGLNRVRVALSAPAAQSHEVLIEYEPVRIAAPVAAAGAKGARVEWTFASAVGELKDPQGAVSDVQIAGTNVSAVVAAGRGTHTLYARLDAPCVWMPVTLEAKPASQPGSIRATAGKMGQETTRRLDLSAFMNATKVRVTSFWRDEERNTPPAAMLEVGRSGDVVGPTKPSSFPRALTVPVNAICSRLDIRYVCEAASRHTGGRVGAVIFTYTKGRTETTDLVLDGNLRVGSWYNASEDVLKLACDASEPLEKVTVRLDAADSQLGILEMSVATPGASLPEAVVPESSKVKWVDLIRDTFDGQKAGRVPDGWTLETGAGGITVEHVLSATNGSVRIADNSTTAGSSMSRSFPPQKGRIRVEALIRQESKEHGMEMMVNNAAIVRIHSSGKLNWVDATGEHGLCDVQPGVFYRVRIEADVSEGCYRVYVNNERLANRVPFAARITQLDTITFSSWGSTSGTNHVDDVVVSREATEAKGPK